MLLRVIDRAMQAYGAAGLSQDTPLAFFYAQARTLRYADGPDEVSIVLQECLKSLHITDCLLCHRYIRTSLAE